jgi:hypothetical protein
MLNREKTNPLMLYISRSELITMLSKIMHLTAPYRVPSPSVNAQLGTLAQYPLTLPTLLLVALRGTINSQPFSIELLSFDLKRDIRFS